MDSLSKVIMLEKVLSILQLELTALQKEKLLKFCDLILEGLKKQRLTGEKTAEKIIGKQFFDSLYPLKRISIPDSSKIIDLGSGAGLPGIPLKICLPGAAISLLDANRKKINFLKETAEALEIDKADFLLGRAELFGHSSEHREQYDYLFSKAVAETVILAELALPLLRIGGCAIFYKGPRGSEEAKTAHRAVAVCGGRFEEVWQYELPTGEKRFLYLISKERETPLQYPRAVGKPARKPLL